jgi:pyruvate kinase
MLSGETASGKYPLEAVRTMAKIARRTEEALDYVSIFKAKGIGKNTNTTDAISHATVQISKSWKPMPLFLSQSLAIPLV